MNNIDRRTFVLGAGGALSLSLWGCGGGGPMPLLNPMAAPAAVTPQGVVFATLPRQHAMVLTGADGSRTRIGRLGRGRGEFNYPADVEVMGERAYVVETGNHRVQVFDATGQSAGALGLGILSYPGGVAAGRNEILVSDSRHSRIIGFDARGGVTRILGEGILSAPRGLSVMSDGNLVVADPGLREVVVMTPEGRLLSRIDGWTLPYDVAADGEQVYAIDAAANEVVALTPSGERVAAAVLEFSPSFIAMRGGTLCVG